MATVDPVRASRDGDQFHYYWAARRCLGLLAPDAQLVAVSIEGPAVQDRDQFEEGVASIDVAEYRGDVDPSKAAQVRYLQLKHSTLRTDTEWVASDLTDTLQNFGRRYVQLVEKYGAEDIAARFVFEFVTNRPFANSLVLGLDHLRSRRDTPQARAAAHATRLPENVAPAFARLLTLTGRVEHLAVQEGLLHDDVSGYLPEADRDAPLHMKDLVTQRATTKYEHRPEITRLDVLKALGVDMRDLFPAPLRVDVPTRIVPRRQLDSLAARIVAGGCISIISADAGVGKTVLSTQLGGLLPKGSRTLVYDCFGNGSYRSASEYRHRCRDGLVQIANELAGLSLCNPLIPTSKADPSAYVRAFLARVESAAATLRQAAPDAMLCLVIDAADNAEMAAAEVHDPPSFPRLLLRETNWPANVRVVMTARPHRVVDLDPPASIEPIQLEPFDVAESTEHLRGFFPSATSQDAIEFHRQTSRNPRVQATALAQGGSLHDVLISLAGEPRTVDALIGDLLRSAINRVLAETPRADHGQVRAVCAALATLRPFVPLRVVASVAAVSIDLVRSLAHDLQRPLILREDAIQFRDEPTETWFREEFKPTGAELDSFIDRLLPLAGESAYVAAGIPQLLLEAGRFKDLVKLALLDDALPLEPAMARRDVGLQRLQFALKAAIRDKRHLEATMLALKAGGETAADARQQKLISANTDLGARFLEPDRMIEHVSRRLITGGDWVGSEHAYEAAFLAGSPDLAGDARSRLRVADDWLMHWAARPSVIGSKRGNVTRADAAEMALAVIRLEGAESCAKHLRRWKMRERSFGAGGILVSRLVDAGDFDLIDGLAIAAGNDLGLLLAITSKLASVGRLPPKPAVERMTRLVTSRHVRIREPAGFDGEMVVLAAVTDVVVAAARMRVAPKRLLARTVGRYIPAMRTAVLEGRSASYQDRRGIYMAAQCVRAVLRNETMTLDRLRPREPKPVQEKLSKPAQTRRSRNRRSRETAAFTEQVGGLLPWHRLAAEVRLGRVASRDIDGRIEAAKAASATAGPRSYDEDRPIQDEIAVLWSGVALSSPDSKVHLERFEEWRQGLTKPLFIPTLIAIARRAGRTTDGARTCLDLARAAYAIMGAEREDASSIADTCVEACRVVLLVSPTEATEFFEQAIEVSGKIGEENLSRWQALANLAEAAGGDGVDRPELAYRFSRVAELVVAYSTSFSWDYALESLAALSPSSAPTIASRWIDRKFADRQDTLGWLVAALTTRKALDPRDAIALLPFREPWPRILMLKRALEASADARERDAIATHFIRYARHCHHDAEDWRRVGRVLSRFGVEASEVADFAKAAARAAGKQTTRPLSRRKNDWKPKNRKTDWDAIFRDIPLNVPGGVADALARYRSGEPPWAHDEFYAAAISRVQPGQEADFLRSIDATDTLGIVDGAYLLKNIPDDWFGSLAVKRATRALLLNLARRECTRITTSRSYQPFPFDLISKIELTRDEVVRAAVAAMGDTALPVRSEDLFDLAGLLSTMIAPTEAAEALGYGLELLEPLLIDGDDGPWRAQLEPPLNVTEAVAGFVWAALASPWSERRWEAAHAVRALCALGRESVLEALARLADAEGGGAFAAPQLRFYALNARLWLVIALSRAAMEHPTSVARFLPLLEAVGRRSEPHVLIREFAARALLALHKHGLVYFDAVRRDELTTINQSKLPGIERVEGRSRARGPATADDPVFRLAQDFDQYWVAPLADVFGLSNDDVEKAAAATAGQLFGPEETGHHERDLRMMRRQFDNDHYLRLSSYWPKVDDLKFYHSAHALMIAAGQFLDVQPLEMRDNVSDRFDDWLNRHRLSLRGDRWLSDRRDDKPTGLWLELPMQGPSDRIGTADLERLIMPPRGRIVASADWETHRGYIQQRVDVVSVLVSADRSADLARALQSATNHDDYRLPTSEGDEAEIDRDGWSLRGVMRDDEGERHLDRYDPWAAGLRARIPAPGSLILGAIGATGDPMDRFWRDSRGSVKLRADVWSDGEEGDHDLVHDRGQRLLATRRALDRLMKVTGTHLLLEVRLRMERVENRHSRYSEKEKMDAINVTRYVVLRPGCRSEFPPVATRPRRSARSRTRS